jgi:DNA-binding NarL/FixJ family response regulator
MTSEIVVKDFRMFPDTKRNKADASVSPAQAEMNCSLYTQLSQQELQIIIAISKGLTNQQISEHLTLKEGTIRNYITSIFEKTKFKNRTQIAVYAYTAGIMRDTK